ncbi:hypothetical protein CLAIMM_08756 [Cladophialophora immunda]|nr:hypothetical protein CLAIMM_08756 [Cladophialophora immunda]
MDTSPANTRPTRNDKDDWHHVTDARARKRIQDKLAQRARRKRLREAKTNTPEIDHAPPRCRSHITQTEDDTPPGIDLLAQLGCQDPVATLTCWENISASLTARTSQPLQHSPKTQVSTLNYELCPLPTVFSALYINGAVLGLRSCSAVPALSSPASPNVPLSLQPTTTQLLTIHQPGIDRFPFAKMRDNLINMCAVIDEEDFTRDLFTMPSFNITPGLASWDPKAWKIERYFADKWGFLFF